MTDHSEAKEDEKDNACCERGRIAVRSAKSFDIVMTAHLHLLSEFIGNSAVHNRYAIGGCAVHLQGRRRRWKGKMFRLSSQEGEMGDLKLREDLIDYGARALYWSSFKPRVNWGPKI